MKRDRQWFVRPCGGTDLWWRSWSSGWTIEAARGCCTRASLKTKKQAIRCAEQALRRGADEVDVSIVRGHGASVYVEYYTVKKEKEG